MLILLLNYSIGGTVKGGARPSVEFQSKTYGGKSMKVKALRDYNDLQLKKLIKAGTEFQVPEKRAKELASTNNASGMVLVEIVEEVAKPKNRGKE